MDEEFEPASSSPLAVVVRWELATPLCVQMYQTMTNTLEFCIDTFGGVNIGLDGGVNPSGWTTGQGKTYELCRPQSEKV